MHILQKMLDSMEYDTYSYSGRNMHGEQCLGVTVKNNQFTLFADILAEVKDIPENELADVLDSLNWAFLHAKIDNMGLDYVVYFPEIEYSSEETS